MQLRTVLKLYPGTEAVDWRRELDTEGNFTVWVHAHAQIGVRVRMGPRCLIGPGVLIEDSVLLGSNVIVGPWVEIGACSTIEDDVDIGERVRIESRCSIGAGVGLANLAIVNAGATVLHSELGVGAIVPPGAVMEHGILDEGETLVTIFGLADFGPICAHKALKKAGWLVSTVNASVTPSRAREIWAEQPKVLEALEILRTIAVTKGWEKTA